MTQHTIIEDGCIAREGDDYMVTEAGVLYYETGSRRFHVLYEDLLIYITANLVRLSQSGLALKYGNRSAVAHGADAVAYAGD